MTQIEKITNELRERRISQKDFCESLDIKSNTFSTWKARGTSIPSKYVVRICNYFEWSTEEFLECESENQSCEQQVDSSINISNSGVNNQVHATINTNGIEKEFYSSFNNLSLSAKAKVIALVAELSEGENNEG